MGIAKLGLGTAQFGMNYGVANTKGQIKKHEIEKILNFSLLNNISIIDTAIEYGDSEKNLGICGVSKLKVVTKLPEIKQDRDDIQKSIINLVKMSVLRLKVPKLYGLLIHKPEQLFSVEGELIHTALKQAQYMGYVDKIGISAYDPDLVKAILEKFDFDIVQVPLNLIDRRLVREDYHKTLKDMGIEVHARSIFMQGLLLMAKSEVPGYFKKWNLIWEQWHEWLLSHSVSALDTCLAFALSFPEVDHVIIGTDSLQQWRETVTSASNELNLNFPNIETSDLSLINPSNWNM